jgi:carbon monoxide dehydrogenase subunit G
MARFSSTTDSEAVVAADRGAIWAALTDPQLLPRLTPLLQRIDTDGDLWRWHLRRIPVLGVVVSPSFTERMVFSPQQRIDYRHEPPAGAPEQAGADGWYRLDDAAGGTRLAISLTLHVDLPLPGAARPAVDRVMQATLQHTGDRFAANLERHLGVR